MKIKWQLLLAISGPLLLFLIIGLEGAFSHYPAYDDAYNATVAKNLASGFGYSTSYGILIPFNPEVTTGPSLLIPATILMKFIGAKYWVPSFSTLLISLVLILITFVLVYRNYAENSINPSKSKFWLLLSFALLCLSFFWILDISEIELLGEFPSGLFVVAGILVIFRSYSKVSVIIGGILLGLAVMSKLSSLIMVIAVYIVWTVFFLIDRKTIKFTGSKGVPIFLLTGLIIPIVFFESWKLISLGTRGFLDNSNSSFDFFLSNGSGINETLSLEGGIIKYTITNLLKNFEVIKDSPNGIFRFYLFFILLFGIMVSIFSKIRTRAIISNINRISCAAFVATTAYFLWWLLLSSRGWYRHLQPGIVVMSFAIVISSLALFRHKAVFPLTFIMIIWIVLYPSNWVTILNKKEIPSELMSATSTTINFIVNEQNDGRTLLGCGWWANRRLEYLMPSTLNFHDCYSSDLRGSDLVVDRDFWNWEQNPSMVEIERRCSQLLLEIYPYSIFRCE